MDYSKTEIEKLNKLVEKLEDFRQKLQKIDYIHNQNNFFDTMRKFRMFIALKEHNDLYDIFSHSKYFDEYKDFFSKVNMYYIRALESVQTISIMTKSNHNSNNLLELLDSQLIIECYERKGEEINSLDFANAKKLVCVWSGPMPETLLYIYENTDIEKIVWLDIDHEAIFMAWNMIRWLKFNNINLMQMDGRDYDYSDTDIVYIPLFVWDKDWVLKQIAETWKKEIQILINSPKWLWNLIYDGIKNTNPRLRITFRNDDFSIFKAQEIIKFEKYDF